METLILMHIDPLTGPLAPPQPGSFVVGYLEGSHAEAERALNSAKKEGTNVLLRKAWFVQARTEFVPVQEPGADPRGPTRVAPNYAFSLTPLTMFDPVTGGVYSVPATWWSFPEGTIAQHLEETMERTGQAMAHRRSNLSIHGSVPADIRGMS